MQTLSLPLKHTTTYKFVLAKWDDFRKINLGELFEAPEIVSRQIHALLADAFCY